MINAQSSMFIFQHLGKRKLPVAFYYWHMLLINHAKTSERTPDRPLRAGNLLQAAGNSIANA
jgi:hypothetical protein